MLLLLGPPCTIAARDTTRVTQWYSALHRDLAIMGMAGQMGVNGYPEVAGELNGYAELLIRATGGRMQRTTRQLTPVDEARADAQSHDVLPRFGPAR